MLIVFIIKPEVAGMMTMTSIGLVGILLRNLVFLTPMFLCRLQTELMASMIALPVVPDWIRRVAIMLLHLAKEDQDSSIVFLLT